jgi:hypothetical protein
MEISEVRRRLRMAIEDAKRHADERRAKKDAAAREWEGVLADVAIPLFQQIALVLNAEGYHYTVTTPGSAVRLVPKRGGEEFIELSLDTEGDEPVVMIRSTRGRGRRSVARERSLGARSAVDVLTDNALADEIIDVLKHHL